jgi:hypothetical protein
VTRELFSDLQTRPNYLLTYFGHSAALRDSLRDAVSLSRIRPLPRASLGGAPEDRRYSNRLVAKSAPAQRARSGIQAGRLNAQVRLTLIGRHRVGGAP